MVITEGDFCQLASIASTSKRTLYKVLYSMLSMTKTKRIYAVITGYLKQISMAACADED
jgi:hypothetical protein